MRKTILGATALVALTSCSGLLALKDSGDAGPDATAPDAATDSAESSALDASTDGGVEDAPEASDSGGCDVLLSQAQLNLVRGASGSLAVKLSGSACAQAVPVASGLPSGVTLEGPDSEAGPPFFLFRATAGAALGPAQVGISAGAGGGAPLTILVQDPPGTVDTTFGDGGVVLVKNVDNLTSDGVVVAPDGSIYVSGNVALPVGCGGAACTSTAIVLAKLDATGAPDPSFGTQGVSVHTGVAPYADNTPLCLAVAADGGLRTAGYTSAPSYHSLVAAAFTPAGRPDTTFGAGGFFTRDVGTDSKANVGLLQPDGRYVLGGFSGGAGVMVRVTSLGQLDSSFGDGGVVSPPGGVNTMGFLSTGAIIVGEGWPASQSSIARYTANGALDPTYGDGGSVAGPVSVRGSANLVVEPNDQVVYGGAILDDGGTNDVVALWRFRTDGSLDPSFGHGGIATVALPPGSAAINALQRAPDGRYAAAITLTANGGSNSSSSIVAARFTATGALDPTFGGTGFVNAGLEASSVLLEGIAFDSYGRIIVAGVTVDPDNSSVWDALVVRYWP